MKQGVVTEKAPGAIGPYSQGVVFGNLMITSGQLPIDTTTGKMPHDIAEQTRISLENVKAVLEAGGASLNQVVKTTVFLNDMEDFSKMNAVYQEYFSGTYPARSAVEVARLPKDALVEIEAIAIVK